MDPIRERELILTRRQFFGRPARASASMALGLAAESELFAGDDAADPEDAADLPDLPHFAPKAKRVIYLHQSGAPSQIDLFDYKPKLADIAGPNLPDSIRKGQRITGMTSGQNSLPVAPSIFKFNRAGKTAPGSANCCRTPPRSSTTSPS